MRYCEVDNTGAVLRGPMDLPRQGVRLSDGARTGNLDQLSDEILRDYGWYPANEILPGYDSRYYALSLTFRTLNTTTQEVDCAYDAVERPLAQVKADKVMQVQQEALKRLAALYPVLADAQIAIQDINLVGELLSDTLAALDSTKVPTNLSQAKALYATARQGVDAVKALLAFTDVKNFDPLTDVTWPV